MLLTSFVRGSTLIFDSLILLSSSARGSKLIKLGSVSVLHLKADQTCNFNFVICLLTWTYPLLPAWLRFCLCHACLLNWTYNSDANCIFYSSGLTSGCQFFSSSFIYLDLPLSASQKTSNPAQLGFLKTPILFEYYLLSPRRFF